MPRVWLGRRFVGFIDAVRISARQLEYPVLIAPLAAEDRGGFVATVPDLPGCMSDGETREDAIHNVVDAIEEWIEASRTLGRAVPPLSQQAQLAS